MRHDPGHSFDAALVQLAGTASSYPPGGPVPADRQLRLRYQPTGSASTATGRRDAMLQRGLSCPLVHQLAREFVVCDHWFASHPRSTPGPTASSSTPPAAAEWTWNPDTSASSSAGRRCPTTASSSSNGTIYDPSRATRPAWALPALTTIASRPFPYLPPMVSTLKERQPPVGRQRSRRARRPISPTPRSRDVSHVHTSPQAKQTTTLAKTSTRTATRSTPSATPRGDQLDQAASTKTIRNHLVWEHSLLIITWDEHGGFYDHVAPPAAVSPADAPAGRRQQATVSPSTNWDPRPGADHLPAHPEEPDRPPRLRPRLGCPPRSSTCSSSIRSPNATATPTRYTA